MTVSPLWFVLLEGNLRFAFRSFATNAGAPHLDSEFGA